MDKADLLVRRLMAEPVDIPGVGTVQVRGLSHGEILDLRDKGLEPRDLELTMVALAMVDPELSTDEVREWAYASPGGELDIVTRRIRELSGLGSGAQKSGGESVDDG